MTGTPPRSGRRTTLVTRVGLLVAVVGVAVALLVGLVGLVGYAQSSEPFAIETPLPDAPVGAAEGVHLAGTTGELGSDSLWVLTVGPGSAGPEVYTFGGRAVTDDSRWAFDHRPLEGRMGQPVRLVVLRADGGCAASLSTMQDLSQGSGKFYGPLPQGCSPLGEVPVRLVRP